MFYSCITNEMYKKIKVFENFGHKWHKNMTLIFKMSKGIIYFENHTEE